MKKIFLPCCIVCALFWGCTPEYGPAINFSNTAYKDSVYTLAASQIPTANPHEALVEDFTGQGCSNCPDAHAVLDGLVSASGGRVNVICMYIYNFFQTIPPNGAKYDFRDSAATTIGNEIYGGIPAMPLAGIDRFASASLSYSNDLYLYTSKYWSTIIQSELNVADSLNVSVSSRYNSTSDSATLTVTVTYLQNVSTAQNISLAIVEDSITDLQNDDNSAYLPSGIDSFYVFTDVLRSYISFVPTGDPILPKQALKKAGTVDVRTYTAGLNSAWVPAHCRVVAYVNNANYPYNILQSTQCKLTP